MIENLIARARRRLALNETMAQFAFAAAVCVGGFVLMLIFGTRFLEWWTLGLFAAVGIAIGAHRVYRRIPDSYSTAVRLDANAQLHDALSTALYYSRSDLPAHAAGSASFRASQRQQAEAAASVVQLEQAVPFVAPRALYAMAALCVLASVLVAIRYGMGEGLDLRAPITQLFFEDHAAHDAKKAQATYPKSQKAWMQEAQSLLSKLGVKQDPEKPLPGDEEALSKAIEDALQNPADPNAQPQQGDKGGSAGKKGQQAKGGDPQSNAQQSGDPLDNGDQQAKENQQEGQGSSPKSGESNSKSTSAKNGTPSNHESLLSRLKDAVSSMLSKSDKSQDSPQSQKNQQQAKNDQQSGKGQAGKGAQQQGEASQADAQDGQPDDSQNGQQAQGKLNSPDNKSPSQGGSGIGSQDGNKEMKAAAQLKAMGKISEIIGQRAATVSGETSVEVESGAQKLHTDYSNTNATHAQTDGDVTRDEIPLALQSYVQQYFAEVRKASGAGKTKK
jgi:hypothetical protein